MQLAAVTAGIDTRITPHGLRQAFATHLLKQKVDIRIIQVLLGHKRLDTTSLYAAVDTDLLRRVISPLDQTCDKPAAEPAPEPSPKSPAHWQPAIVQGRPALEVADVFRAHRPHGVKPSADT